jgi:hypothetical protein
VDIDYVREVLRDAVRCLATTGGPLRERVAKVFDHDARQKWCQNQYSADQLWRACTGLPQGLQDEWNNLYANFRSTRPQLTYAWVELLKPEGRQMVAELVLRTFEWACAAP